MERHEDPFFESVRTELYGMEVTPPQAAYTGIRKKMGRSVFSGLNVAAVLVASGLITATLIGIHLNDAEQADLAVTSNSALDVALTASHQRIVERDLSNKERARGDEEVFEAPFKAPAPLHVATTAPKEFHVRNADTQNVTELTVESIEEQSMADEVEVDREALHTCSETAAPKVSTAPELQSFPKSWHTMSSTLDAEHILNQLESNSEVIRMSIEVKVPVDDKD